MRKNSPFELSAVEGEERGRDEEREERGRERNLIY